VRLCSEQLLPNLLKRCKLSSVKLITKRTHVCGVADALDRLRVRLNMYILTCSRLISIIVLLYAIVHCLSQINIFFFFFFLFTCWLKIAHFSNPSLIRRLAPYVRTDRQTTCNVITALCVASGGKKGQRQVSGKWVSDSE